MTSIVLTPSLPYFAIQVTSATGEMACVALLVAIVP
jgi:hypothetical protein